MSVQCLFVISMYTVILQCTILYTFCFSNAEITFAMQIKQFEFEFEFNVRLGCWVTDVLTQSCLMS